VKAFTEALQHELRNTAGLPGQRPSADSGLCLHAADGKGTDREAGCRLDAEQTVDFMMESLEKGDFYILCPDNDVDSATDEKRIAWAAGDIIENRPPLSRWHPDWAERFKAFLKQ
jgi:hypothetical protein